MQGTPLHITVRKNMIPNFTHMLKEGKVYSIKNLKIAAANEKYRPLKGTLKGLFLLTTILKEINDPVNNIPQQYFEFASLQTISERVGDKNILTGNIINNYFILNYSSTKEIKTNKISHLFQISLEDYMH